MVFFRHLPLRCDIMFGTCGDGTSAGLPIMAGKPALIGDGTDGLGLLRKNCGWPGECVRTWYMALAGGLRAICCLLAI